MLRSNYENGPFSSPRVEGNPGDPNWNLNRNPNLGFGPSIQFPDANDRSSKRLRVDGFYPAAAAAANLPIEYEDNDRRRLRLVRDHGSPFLLLAANDCHTTNFYHHPPDNITTTFHQHQHQHQGPLSHSYNIHSHLHPHPNYGISQDYFHMHSKDVPVHHDHDLRTNVPTLNHNSYTHPSFPSPMHHHHHQSHHMRFDHGSPHHYTDVRHPRPPPFGSYQLPRYAPTPTPPHYALPPIDYQGGTSYGNIFSKNVPSPHVPPPLSPSPPPPLPMDPPLNSSTDHMRLSSPSTIPPSLFPVPVTTSAPLQSSHLPIPDPNPPVTTLLPNSHLPHTPHGMFQGDRQGALTSFGQYHGDGHTFSSKINFPDKPKIIDAVHLFKPPHRTSRPDYFVIILRGLPGSGKSYLAKLLRDLEVEHGGNAPRIHSMDDYFMTEVEKIEEGEASKSSARGKKPTRKVLEYCYEPEMEEAYRSSMLKAFKKTLEEGAFTFIIVDDRNLRVADFAQFWATAKRSGYEVYVLEAPYKDPAGCTARNVHGFTQVDIEKMAAQWEDAPSMYLQVDVKCLVQGDELKESNIQEVDMDTEDGDVDGSLPNSEERGAENIVTASARILELDGSWKDKRNWDAEVCIPTEEVKELGRSKWSNNFDDEDNGRTEVVKSKAHVLSGLVKTYGREGKSVHWGDQGIRTGFSIGAVKKANLLSLVIGPGAGYNLKSNPLSEEEAKTGKSRESKKHSMFQERLRAEQESFRAVFDRRRQRIGGLDVQDD